MPRTIQLANGRYDVQDEQGQSLLEPFGGPYYTPEAAEATRRMIAAFDAVESQIASINNGLRTP